jgi:phosphatidylinositol alpha-1,6-mannosyltransferase
LQLLLTYDFPPMGGGIARWMGEVAKRYPLGSLIVSTGRYEGDSATDQLFPNRVDRLPIPAARLRTLQGTVRWSRRAAALGQQSGAEFTWCGNIKPAAYPARWTKARVGVPYGILVHGGDLLILQRQIHRSRLKRRAARALLGSASVLVSNSRWTGTLSQIVLKELGLDAPAPRLEVVPLGADPAVFRPGLDQDGVRRRYGLGQRRWLLSVARLTRHKGIDTGIRVLGRLARVYPDLGYIVVGTGEELASLEKLALGLGIADRVKFLTGVPDADLPPLYNCAEVYLGLSRLLDQRVEGFGISLVEAASCGIPVIAGRSGGIPEAVHDGETGVLVDGEQPEQVEGVLKRLLDDSALRSRLGGAGRRAVERYYNWDRVSRDLIRIGCHYGRAPSARSRSGG